MIYTTSLLRGGMAFSCLQQLPFLDLAPSSVDICLLLAGNWLVLPVLAFLAIAFTAMINFTNFMDGLDGLVVSCLAVSIAALANALSAPGRYGLWWVPYLGFCYGTGAPPRYSWEMLVNLLEQYSLVFQASSWPEAFGYFRVATPLVADACLCLLRRWHAGQPVFQAHRLHLFQRLHQAGWPHERVSLTYVTATSLLASAMLAGGWSWVFGLAVAELLLGFWLDQRVAVPFSVASIVDGLRNTDW